MTSHAAMLPTFLNADYIVKALTKAYAIVDLQLLSCDIKHASANGDNFCSDIYRACVEYTQNGGSEITRKCFVLKVMIPEIAAIGSNEYEMYATILPGMEKLLLPLKADGVRLAAHCLLSERSSERELYVLDDLNALGFELADRWLGLDEPHAMAVMRKLGQFHAASLLYAAQNPGVLEALRPAHLAEGAADFVAKSITMGGMTHAASIVAEWEDYGEIANKMHTLIEKFNERIKKLFLLENCKVRVLNHADLWVNNFLCSHTENGAPEDIAFVDFQNSFLGSPGCDINYFLNTSVQLEVLRSRRYELQRAYYKSLRTTLEICGYETQLIPSWQLIMEEIRNTELLGYYAAVCELAICCMDKEASKDMTVHTFSDPEAMTHKRQQIFANTRVLEMLRYSLDRFNELGVLD